jgi:uncharacterized protein (TIGR02598 family)
MIRRLAPSVPPRTKSAGFTLSEVVLALAIVAFAFVATLSLLPLGMNQSRGAADSSAVAAILEDVNNRLHGAPLVAGPAPFSPAYFDVHGVYLDPAVTPSNQSQRLYRADVQIGKWFTAPTGTSGLTPVTIQLSWPVDPNSGVALGKFNPQATLTYTVTPLTGSNWTAIDSTYVPNIEY